MAKGIHHITVQEALEEIVPGLRKDFKIKLATADKNFHILSIYPDEGEKTIWIDIEETR